MVSFEIFVKSMLPSLSESKVLPSFCFAFKIPDDVAVTNIYYDSKLLVPMVCFAELVPTDLWAFWSEQHALNFYPDQTSHEEIEFTEKRNLLRTYCPVLDIAIACFSNQIFDLILFCQTLEYIFHS